VKEDSPVTEFLAAWSHGDPQALEDLVVLVHTELWEMSRRALRGERHADTLNPTALVNEVFIRLAKLKKVSWENRKPFFAFTSTLMRRVLVEHARARKADKRSRERVDLELVDLPDDRETIDTLELDDVLSQLEKRDPFLHKIIELKFFAGLTENEIAEVLEVNRTKVQREWRVGKLLLAKLLRGELHDEP
jgi:RNA polymerase sigma factor (TIGR02999 family)